jgi:hypothetical protein
MILKNFWKEDVGWIRLAYYKDQRWADLNTVMNLWVP